MPEGSSRDELAALMLLNSEKKFLYMVMNDRRGAQRYRRFGRRRGAPCRDGAAHGVGRVLHQALAAALDQLPQPVGARVSAIRLFLASCKPLLQGDLEALTQGERGFETERVAKLLYTIFPLRPSGQCVELAFVPYHKSLVD